MITVAAAVIMTAITTPAVMGVAHDLGASFQTRQTKRKAKSNLNGAATAAAFKVDLDPETNLEPAWIVTRHRDVNTISPDASPSVFSLAKDEQEAFYKLIRIGSLDSHEIEIEKLTFDHVGSLHKLCELLEIITGDTYSANYGMLHK